MDKAPTLICIPDISGFTEFMTKVNFGLGAKVVPSLLNKIIYSNEIGLKVSEIEGDAVLFYRQGKLPPLEALIDQCKNFYQEFYKHLYELRQKYNESKNAIKIPEILGLKIILHYGQEIAPVSIGKHIKLMGEDVIAAHRLLKNDVPIDEYILLSEELLEEYALNGENLIGLFGMQDGHIQDEHMGKIHFTYIPLDTNH